MADGDIHPAIFVEIENGDSRSRRELRIVYRLGRIFAFARIHIEQRRRTTPRHGDVDGAIIVEIGENRRRGSYGSAETRRLCPFAEGFVAVIAPEHIGALARFGRGAGQQQIEVAIVIEINERNPRRAIACT